MKNPKSEVRSLAGAGICFLLSAFCFGAFAQYSIPWHTIDGGGGTSTGGVYSVSGNLGQPDAGGPMTNGPYSLVGGFWAFPMLVQTPGVPTRENLFEFTLDGDRVNVIIKEGRKLDGLPYQAVPEALQLFCNEAITLHKTSIHSGI